jgi:succinate-semialdehyde dehydrogenase/glutarate-semialdehyde dehydrogenase
LHWFTEQAARLDNGHPATGDDEQINYVIRQPVGVVACITPWNFPAAAVIVKAGAAIVCGCAAIVKPSEETPLIALALAGLASDAGIPDGVLNVLPCQDPAAVGEALCQDPDVRMLSFTGSIAVGQRLYAACGATVKRLALELGGNAPFIVFDDADLDQALNGAMGARFYNSGQICVGANRYYIHDAIYDEFAEQIADRVQALTVGDGFADNTDIGPMINRAAVDRINGLVKDATASGAQVLAGGTQDDDASLFFPPTVLGNMQENMAAHAAEIFGPVVCLYRFSNEQEVLQLANATEAGLSAYVYTGNADRLEYFAEGLEAGVIGANSSNIFANDLPFGGIKQSGLGREHGPHCLDEYLELKSICRGPV